MDLISYTLVINKNCPHKYMWKHNSAYTDVFCIVSICIPIRTITVGNKAALFGLWSPGP